MTKQPYRYSYDTIDIYLAIIILLQTSRFEKFRK